MPSLRFEVSDPSGAPGAPAVIGEAGGWIGRAPGCEVRLEDPARNVSSRHARVEWTGSAFTIQDESLNGTELNGVRLVRGQATPVAAGDTIRAAGWRIAVSAADAPGTVAADPAGDRGRALPRFDLSLSDLVGPELTGPDAPRLRAMPPRLDALPDLSDLVAPRAAPDPPPPGPPPEPPSPPRTEALPALDTENEALAAFWRGFGIAPPRPCPPALMEELGRALRDACAEAAALLQSEGERDNLLAAGPPGQRELLSGAHPGLSAALRAALSVPSRREQAMRDAALEAASRMAASLSAGALEKRLSASSRPGLFGSRRAALWRQFAALEEDLREAAEGRFRKDMEALTRPGAPRVTWAGGR